MVEVAAVEVDAGGSGAPDSRGRGRGQNQNRGRGRARGRGRGGGAAAAARDETAATTTHDRPIEASLETSKSRSTTNGLDEHNQSLPARGRGSSRGGGSRGNKRGSNVVATSRGDAGGSTAATTEEAISQKPNQSDRRRKFASKLTDAVGDASVQHPKGSQNGHASTSGGGGIKTSARPVEEYTDMRSRLIVELSTGAYDCAVCYSCVSTKSAIWSCSQCYSVLHLSCVQKWADSSVAKIAEQNARHEDPAIRDRKGTWRCPGCQFAREEVPRKYLCWDGQVVDPIGGKGSPPHSCGKPCSKGKCVHGCAAGVCHPGPCPPCPISITRGCFCGGQQITLRCSQLRQSASQIPAGVSCGTTCGKTLECGQHECSRICHDGECGECSVQMEYRCYCGRHTRTMKCGQGKAAKSTGKDGQETWQGRWACEETCSRPFSCGRHACQRACHALEETNVICPFSPGLILTCPCGAEDINAERTSCADEVKTCGRTCNRLLGCGHHCGSLCHLGECPPCTVSVSTPCRCGETKKQLACHQRQREEQEGGQEVLCQTICRSLRLCGRHECRRRCCPLYFQAKSKSKRKPTYDELLEQDPAGLHACDVVCGKLLRCGTHHCEMNCHRGQCPPCLQASFDELSCHCGRTVMDPPIPCGTTIRCHFPCTRPPPPCGHPKQQHDCHETEECPPCIYLVDKVCICGKNTVANVPCHRARVSCGQTCEAVLGCGFHRCQRSCHEPGRCDPCHQTCTKPRKCGHPCPEVCHAPSACPETSPCQAWVTLLCACGHQQQQVRCGHSIHTPQTVNRTLKCTDACLVSQRNAKLAEALGMQPSSSHNRSQASDYPASTMTFYASNRRFAEEVEETLIDFTKSYKHAIMFGPPTASQRAFIHDLAGVYGLQVEDVDEEPKRSVAVRRGMHGKIPSVLLREAYAVYTASNASRSRLSQLKRDDPVSNSLTSPSTSLAGGGGGGGGGSAASSGGGNAINMNALLLKGMFGLDESSLTVALRKVVGGAPIRLRWLSEEDVLAIVSNSTTMKLRHWSQDIRNMGHLNGGYSRLAKDVAVCFCNEAGQIVVTDTGEGGQNHSSPSMSRGASHSGSTPLVSSSVSARSTITGGAWAAVAAGATTPSAPSAPRPSAWGSSTPSVPAAAATTPTSSASTSLRATAPAFTSTLSTTAATRAARHSPRLPPASVPVPDEWDT